MCKSTYFFKDGWMLKREDEEDENISDLNEK